VGWPSPPDVVTALTTGAGSYTWVAAAVGSDTAAGYQLATGRPVMAVGGFNGTDPAPTLAGFQILVRQGRIRLHRRRHHPVRPVPGQDVTGPRTRGRKGEGGRMGR